MQFPPAQPFDFYTIELVHMLHKIYHTDLRNPHDEDVTNHILPTFHPIPHRHRLHHKVFQQKSIPLSPHHPKAALPLVSIPRF